MKPKIFNGVWQEFSSYDDYNQAIAAFGVLDDNSIQNIIKSLEHEQLGKNMIKDLYVTLRNQNLTQAQEGDLLSRINGVLMALGFGFIKGARTIANNLIVAGQLTQARKDYLIGKIDEAILLL